jgi:hypothetical protein
LCVRPLSAFCCILLLPMQNLGFPPGTKSSFAPGTCPLFLWSWRSQPCYCTIKRLVRLKGEIAHWHNQCFWWRTCGKISGYYISLFFLVRWEYWELGKQYRVITRLRISNKCKVLNDTCITHMWASSEKQHFCKASRVNVVLRPHSYRHFLPE